MESRLRQAIVKTEKVLMPVKSTIHAFYVNRPLSDEERDLLIKLLHIEGETWVTRVEQVV